MVFPSELIFYGVSRSESDNNLSAALASQGTAIINLALFCSDLEGRLVGGNWWVEGLVVVLLFF